MYKDLNTILSNSLQLYHAGYDPSLIELPESVVFPALIPAAPSTARKSRTTGLLLGEPAPKFIRRGRTIRYRLSDVLEWLSVSQGGYRSTSEFLVAETRQMNEK